MELQLIDNPEKKRFEFPIGDKLAFIEYIRVEDKIYLTHTEVPRSLNGKGYGSKIVRLALEEVKARDLTLIPLCPFVALYIKRNPEWRELVLKGITIK